MIIADELTLDWMLTMGRGVGSAEEVRDVDRSAIIVVTTNPESPMRWLQSGTRLLGNGRTNIDSSCVERSPWNLVLAKFRGLACSGNGLPYSRYACGTARRAA
ncbi:MAG: hypothetical protein ACLS6O_06050 [Bifidobacterium sp.]